MCSKLTVDKGGVLLFFFFFNKCVLQKSHTLLVKLQCISEPHSKKKNVVNTFFLTNIAFPSVTTQQAIILSCWLPVKI